MDAFAGMEQLTYGELAVREIETFIVIFSLEMVASVEGKIGLIGWGQRQQKGGEA